MSEKSASGLEKFLSIGGLALWMAGEYLKDRAARQGITADQALERATSEYEAAQSENDDLKKLGHE